MISIYLLNNKLSHFLILVETYSTEFLLKKFSHSELFRHTRTLRAVSLTENNGPVAYQMEMQIMINHKLLKFAAYLFDLFGMYTMEVRTTE